MLCVEVSFVRRMNVCVYIVYGVLSERMMALVGCSVVLDWPQDGTS